MFQIGRMSLCMDLGPGRWFYHSDTYFYIVKILKDEITAVTKIGTFFPQIVIVNLKSQIVVRSLSVDMHMQTIPAESQNILFRNYSVYSYTIELQRVSLNG